MPNQFKVWRTIKVGTGLMTPDDFRNDLRQNGCQIVEYASAMLNDPNFVVSMMEQVVNLANVSVAELGFKDGSLCGKIRDQIVEMGHQLCLPEDGPQLRRQYLDQPINEWVQMVMNPLYDSDGSLSAFRVGCSESGLWLYSLGGHSESFWHAEDRLVFRLRK